LNDPPTLEVGMHGWWKGAAWAAVLWIAGAAHAQVGPNEYTFPAGHTAGKWYAEITIQRPALQRARDLRLGVDTVDGFYSPPTQAKLPPPDGEDEVIALIVDLDRKRLQWRSASVPVQGEGEALAPSGKPVTLKLRGAEVHALLAQRQVWINYGQDPFKHAMPPGFRAWYTPARGGEPLRWIAPAPERLAGKSRAQVAAAYWQWLLDRDAAQTPTLDRTGALCGAKQPGEWWFLAGAAEADRIERRCTVPYGTPIVVPVMAVLLNFSDAKACSDNEKLASLAPHTLQNAFLEIDGKRFDRLQDYSASISHCPPMEAGGKLVSPQANWLGLWVPLKDLPRGEHVVSFGGGFKALNIERRVVYRLTIQ
jgi:hypothetical protein